MVSSSAFNLTEPKIKLDLHTSIFWFIAHLTATAVAAAAAATAAAAAAAAVIANEWGEARFHLCGSGGFFCPFKLPNLIPFLFDPRAAVAIDFPNVNAKC
jgi:hypothetical protein